MPKYSVEGSDELLKGPGSKVPSSSKDISPEEAAKARAVADKMAAKAQEKAVKKQKLAAKRAEKLAKLEEAKRAKE